MPAVHDHRRFLIVALLVAVVWAVPIRVAGADTDALTATAFQPLSPQAAIIDDQFFALTNTARAVAGVASLARDPDLEAHARAHVLKMMSGGHIYHSNISSLLGPWWIIGENVGVSPNAPAIEKAYEASPSHYENLTYGPFRYICERFLEIAICAH